MKKYIKKNGCIFREELDDSIGQHAICHFILECHPRCQFYDDTDSHNCPLWQKWKKDHPTMTIKDSGKTQEFETGAHRDAQENKGRFDLIPLDALTRVAKHYEAGAKKYGENNWKKGMPLSRYLDSAMRHTVKLLGGLDDEDHAAAAVWNLMCFMYTEKAIRDGILSQDLDNIQNELVE